YVFSSSHLPTRGTISGNPGSIVDGLIRATVKLVVSAPVFDGLVAELDPRSPNPALPNTFVDRLSNILDNDYDDGDFVVLVGHSLGGNSVLRVANQTHRKIDLLAPLDPVGWSTTGIKETKLIEIIPRLTVEKLGWGVLLCRTSDCSAGTNDGVSRRQWQSRIPWCFRFRHPVGVFASRHSSKRGFWYDHESYLPTQRDVLRRFFAIEQTVTSR